MGRMTEDRVQRYAMKYLEKRYRRKSRGDHFFAREEVRTRKAYGGKRADGLLVFRHWLWGKYVVSMEAKSYKTLPALKPRLDSYKLMWNSLKAGVTVCILTGSFLALYRMSDGLFQFLLPLNVLIIVALLYGVVTYNSNRHKVIAVIEQLMHYPANEQWLAFSVDSFEHLNKADQKMLKSISRYEGVGVLLVKPSGKVKRLIKADRKLKWWGDFTKYYALKGEMR